LTEIEDEPTITSLRAKQKIPCGGFAGLACLEGLTCVDDPSDDCDPKNGDANCIGMCIHGHGGGNGGGNGNNSGNGPHDPSLTYIADSPEERLRDRRHLSGL